MFQMVIKYSNIFNCKTLQNLPEIGIFGLKINHLATLNANRIIHEKDGLKYHERAEQTLLTFEKNLQVSTHPVKQWLKLKQFNLAKFTSFACTKSHPPI
jgi:hypothetical protein